MMDAAEIRGGRPPKPLTFRLADVPHGTVETNLTCNLRCRACYNINRTHVKSLREIKDEIDGLLRKRNIQVVTILGGEPTLHPNLADIVAFVKERGRSCQLLTNGVRFLEEDGNGLLDDLQAAGIDKIIVHMDIGQNHVHADIDAARRVLFSKLEARGILFSLSVTIYKETSGTLAEELERYASFRCFDGVLGVLARDGNLVDSTYPTMREVYVGLRQKLGLEPVAFIPGFPNTKRIGWLIYFSIRNAVTGRVFPISSEVYGLFRRIYRVVRGREFFVPLIGSRWTKIAAFAAAAVEIIFHPQNTRALCEFSAKPFRLNDLRIHYVAIQNPFEIDEETRLYQICFHCPDATIRNGLLTPICIADKINPFGSETEAAPPDPELYRLAYRHLREIRV